MTPLHLDEKGLLRDAQGVHLVPSPRVTTLETARPEGVVWHWSGGPGLGPAYAPALAAMISAMPKPGEPAASWHFLVCKDGRVLQSVSTLSGSWHVGVEGVIAGRHRANINHSTVGIELENAGYLTRRDGAWYCEGYPEPHNAIPQSRVVPVSEGVHVDDFPPAQVEAATALLRALVDRHGLTRDVCGYGHRDFDPTRRRDPGPLWVEHRLPSILDAVFGTPQRAA